MHKVTNIPVVVINPLLTCRLCDGYLIDATTVVECLHSFCRSCIVSHLKFHTTCPVCDTLLHKTRPYYAIRPDRALQAIVYKLIPNLFEKEMAQRRKYYKEHPDSEARSLSPEKRGEITLNAYVTQEEEHMSIELEYWQPDDDLPARHARNAHSDYRSTYLLCPPDLTVGHLEKLIRIKFELKPGEHKVAFFFSSDDLFGSDYTLSDLACLHSWRRREPLKLYFTILATSETLNSASYRSKPAGSTASMDNRTSRHFAAATRTPEDKQQQQTVQKTHGVINADGCHQTSYTTLQIPALQTLDETKNLECFESSFSESVETHSMQQLTLNPTVPLPNNSNPVCSPRA
ncbi:unnamed protein product [Calicophoron daubneyi]|uniref:RING-type domain-containing protein n=1 Tax=Calicophoron daubneyi TaxID=300641 RepID=A0AAV2TTB9_CALDB